VSEQLLVAVVHLLCRAAAGVYLHSDQARLVAPRDLKLVPLKEALLQVVLKLVHQQLARNQLEARLVHYQQHNYPIKNIGGS
jgi:hypothetical protein